MDFLSVREVRQRGAEVREAVDRIVSARRVVGQPGAAQWRFFEACVAAALGEDGRAGPTRPSPAQTAQWKFQVHEKLRRFYERHAGEPGLLLALVHSSRLGQYRVPELESYPSVAGYCVLVRDPASDATLAPSGDGLRPYLERVVVEALAAEWRAYAALPAVDLEGLARWAWDDGALFEEVQERLRKRRQAGWVLSNAFNPSHQRTASVRVRQADQRRAVVNATEVWHLRWWNARTREYIYAFRDTLRHAYVLTRRDHSWRVDRRLRRAPRGA